MRFWLEQIPFLYFKVQFYAKADNALAAIFKLPFMF